MRGRKRFEVIAEMGFRLETYLSAREVEDQVRELLEGLGLGGIVRVGAKEVE